MMNGSIACILPMPILALRETMAGDTMFSSVMSSQKLVPSSVDLKSEKVIMNDGESPTSDRFYVD